MEVDPATALSAQRDGETFYFCCSHCRQKFLAGASTEPQGDRQNPVQLSGPWQGEMSAEPCQHESEKAGAPHSGHAPGPDRHASEHSARLDAAGPRMLGKPEAQPQ